MYLKVSPYLELLQGIPVALQINEGIIKLTGRDGSGKSSLCLALSELLAANGQHVLYFPVPPATSEILQQTIQTRLGLSDGPNFTKQLTRHLLEQTGAGRQLHVIFDNAQDIDELVFNSIRMLCNIQDKHQALVKPIICGTPALDLKLQQINFRSVAQYLSQSFTLAPLTIEQIRDFYWAYWLRRGIQVQPPGNNLVSSLLKSTQGFPGAVMEKLERAHERILERRQGLDLEPSLATPVVTRPKRSAETWLALGFGSLVLAAAGSMYYLYNKVDADASPRTVAQVPAQAATVSTATPAVEQTTPPELPVEAPTLDSATPADVVLPTEVDDEQASAVAESAVAESAAVEIESTAVESAGMESPAVAENLAVEENPPAQDEAAVSGSVAAATALLDAWTTSWTARDIDGYLGHYAADFEPANGATREAWEAQRRGSIGRATDIRISYDSVELVAEDASSITLQFWLHYSASNYADDTLKELVLQKSDAGLLIRNERNLLVEQPQ